ncbi:MAG TPA: ATP-dependent sacrificial sulfur transferase LarE [Ruminococcaceae bacterium]|nr:ATP-dependent sacrificial sulfur transferase LarE [Oscillospiraceae bacterium]
MKEKAFFSQYPMVAVALSGGVDSAYLLYEAKRHAEKVQAYFVKTDFQPQLEWEDAKRIADFLGVELTTVSVDILADEQIAANGADRCYACKKRLFFALAEQARADGFSVLLDGTNASDSAEDRPGMKALQELSVLSPLRLWGLTKTEIRSRAKEAGLFIWNKPAYACLATRILSGQRIEKRLLERTERAENLLFSLGFTDFRVRTIGEKAKIELREEQFPLLFESRNRITEALLQEYAGICLDLEGRHE